MDQKVEKHRFLKYLWLLHTPKKFIQSHLLRLGSGSNQKGPDPTGTGSGSGSATLVAHRVSTILSRGGKIKNDLDLFFYQNE
jgi:hypothetical protein